MLGLCRQHHRQVFGTTSVTFSVSLAHQDERQVLYQVMYFLRKRMEQGEGQMTFVHILRAVSCVGMQA